MLFKKDRKRRVIYNNDSDQQFIGSGSYPYDITDEQSFIDARTTPTFDTHVRHARRYLRLVRRKRLRAALGTARSKTSPCHPSLSGLV